jgi:hypothetical protein
MPEQMALALLAIGLVVGYIVLVFWLARRVARTLGGMFGSRRGQTIVDEDTGIEYDADDEIVEREWVNTGAGGELRVTSRFDRRVRYWYFLVIFPLLIYLHYQFWDPLVVGFEWSFEHLGELIAATFYRGE